VKLKEALVAKGMTSIVVLSINIFINSIVLIFAWNSLLSSIHPTWPALSFVNAVGVMLIALTIRGKFSLQVSVK